MAERQVKITATYVAMGAAASELMSIARLAELQKEVDRGNTHVIMQTESGPQCVPLLDIIIDIHVVQDKDNLNHD